jgi:TRAP-type C4-dicarboxylate transport system permease small subunit
LKALDRTATAVAQALAVVGLVLLLTFAVGTLADGLLRRFAGRPIDAVRDLGGLIAAVAVTCCFPIALLQRSNITIKFVGEFVGARAGKVCDAAASVAVGIVLIFMARQFFIYSSELLRTGDSTTMLNVRVAPFWFVVSFVLWISAAIQLRVIASAIGAVRYDTGTP